MPASLIRKLCAVIEANFRSCASSGTGSPGEQRSAMWGRSGEYRQWLADRRHTAPVHCAGCQLHLRRGEHRREIKLEDFFLAYGKQDRQPGEFVESVPFRCCRRGKSSPRIKVSKRREEDISALCGAFRVFVKRCRRGRHGAHSPLVAWRQTPKRARAVEAALVGKSWSMETVEAVLPLLPRAYQPITDMRASAEYRCWRRRTCSSGFYLETSGQGERLKREVA